MAFASLPRSRRDVGAVERDVAVSPPVQIKMEPSAQTLRGHNRLMTACTIRTTPAPLNSTHIDLRTDMEDPSSVHARYAIIAAGPDLSGARLEACEMLMTEKAT